MKKNRLFLITAWLFACSVQAQQSSCFVTDYTIPSREVNCFQQFDQNQSPGVNNVNAYLLAKMSQLMYSERLDFELRELRNPTGFPSGSFRSIQLNAITNNNFECNFIKRFSHWFYAADKKPVRPAFLNLPNLQLVKGAGQEKILMSDKIVKLDNKPPVKTADPAPAADQPTAIEKYLQDSVAFEKSKPQFRFINKRQDFINIGNAIVVPGFDPELMVVSTEDFIIISWRGTDDVYKGDSWEWIGTDAYFLPTAGDGPLANTKMHSGFWNSFKIVRNKLMSTLDEFEAKAKNKKIFITGHSLGGAMALISAPYLKGKGYSIGEVYTWAAPRVVGDADFVNKCNDLLGRQRIQRFEYGVDFVTKLWSPALYFSSYKIPGHRHWLNQLSNDDDYDCGERSFPLTINPIEYMNFTREKIDKMDGDVGGLDFIGLIRYLMDAVPGNAERPKNPRGFALMDFGQHNPTFYVKKMFEHLSASQKGHMPSFKDTYPYVYPGVSGNK